MPLVAANLIIGSRRRGAAPFNRQRTDLRSTGNGHPYGSRRGVDNAVGPVAALQNWRTNQDIRRPSILMDQQKREVERGHNGSWQGSSDPVPDRYRSWLRPLRGRS